MTFGFIVIKNPFNVSNDLCQAQTANAGRKWARATTSLHVSLANKTKGSQDFPRNITLSSATSEPPVGYEEAQVAIKQRSQVFHSN